MSRKGNIDASSSTKSHICTINEALIRRQSGLGPYNALEVITSLDLHLRDSKLGKIHVIEGLKPLTSLQKLNLSYNSIGVIQGLAGLPIVELNLAENNITRIEHVQDLQTLERLNLSGNRISRIPSSMSRLRHLSMLRMSRNHLGVIEDISNLKDIRGLSNFTADDNPITSEEDTASATRAFAIHILPSLATFSGRQVSGGERQEVYRSFSTGSGFQTLADAQELIAERSIALLRRSRGAPAASDSVAVARTVSSVRPRGHALDSPSVTTGSRSPLGTTRGGTATADASSAEDIVELSGRLEELAGRLLDSERDKDDALTDLADARRELSVAASVHDAGRGAEGRSLYGFSPPRPPTRPALRHPVSTMDTSLQQDLDISREEERSVRLLSTRYAEELEQALAALEREKRLNSQLRRQVDDFTLERETSGGVTLQVRHLETRLRESEAGREEAVTAAHKAESELERTRDKLASVTVRLDTREKDLQEARERCRVAESEREALEASVAGVERAAAKATVAAEDALRQRQEEEERRFRAEREVASLTARLGAMQRDMDAYLQAANRSDLLKVMATKGVIGTLPQQIQPSADMARGEAERVAAGVMAMGGDGTSGGGGGVASLFAKADRAERQATLAAKAERRSKTARRRKAAYFDVSSTDTSVAEGYAEFKRGLDRSSSGDEEEEEEQEGDGTGGGYGPPIITDPTIRPHIVATGLPTERPKSLEAAAVEAVAYILYSELSNADLSALRRERDQRRRESQRNGGAPPSAVDLSKSTIGHACVTSAMRLIKTAIRKSRGGESEKGGGVDSGAVRPVTADDIVLPLSALGDRMVLADMVMEAQAGLVALSMAESCREEQLHLNRVIGELEATAKALSDDIDKKRAALSDVNHDVDAARDRATEVVHQLEDLVGSLTEKREEMASAESALQILRKEVECARRDLAETQSLADLEQKSLASTKEKLRILREESSHCEANIARTRHSVSEQEGRIRAAKASAGEELRAVQAEHSRITSELAGRQAECEELDRYKHFLENEADERRKTLESQTQQLDREVEEATRNVSALRSEARAGRLECDQILGRKRNIQVEFDRLSDALTALQVRKEAEEESLKRGLENLNKRNAAAEKLDGELRSRINAHHSEITALKRSVEDLSRQEHDLGRSIEARRRTAEAELQHANQLTEAGQRASREASSQAEDKKQQLEALAADVRLVDRRAEEHKRMLRDLEDILQHARAETKTSELERERMRKEATQARHDCEEATRLLNAVRHDIEKDSKTADELKRRLVALHEEEHDLRTSEENLKQTHSAMRKNIQDMTLELNSLRLGNERERRVMTDVKAKRSVLENDLARLGDEVQFHRDMVVQEEKRAQEAAELTQRSREECGRVGLQLVAANNRLQESVQRERDLQRKERDISDAHSKLRAEAAAVTASLEAERKTLADVKIDVGEATTALRVLQEEMKQTDASLAASRLQLDTARSAMAQGQDKKEALLVEIRRLEERIKEEHTSLTRTEIASGDAERRLRDLRAETQRTEECYDRLRADVLQEERKVSHLRRQLQHAESELHDAEAQAKATAIGIEEERKAAVQEVIELGATKQLVQSRLLSIAEAQRRLDGEYFSVSAGATAARTTSAIKSSHPLPSPGARASIGSEFPRRQADAKPPSAPIPVYPEPSSLALVSDTIVNSTQHYPAPVASPLPSSSSSLLPPSSSTPSGGRGVGVAPSARGIDSLRQEVERLKDQSQNVLKV